MDTFERVRTWLMSSSDVNCVTVNELEDLLVRDKVVQWLLSEVPERDWPTVAGRLCTIGDTTAVCTSARCAAYTTVAILGWQSEQEDIAAYGLSEALKLDEEYSFAVLILGCLLLGVSADEWREGVSQVHLG